MDHSAERPTRCGDLWSTTRLIGGLSRRAAACCSLRQGSAGGLAATTGVCSRGSQAARPSGPRREPRRLGTRRRGPRHRRQTIAVGSYRKVVGMIEPQRTRQGHALSWTARTADLLPARKHRQMSRRQVLDDRNQPNGSRSLAPPQVRSVGSSLTARRAQLAQS